MLIAGLCVGAGISLSFFPPLETPRALLTACVTPAGPDIRALAGYVLDIKHGTVLYEKNGTTQLPLASVAKLVTVLTAARELGSETIVTISDEALTPFGESGLTLGEKWQAQDLTDFTLITSSNDGARALFLEAAKQVPASEEEFIDTANRRIGQLGLMQTYLINETGLDESSTLAGAYGSARDVALLLAELTRSFPNVAEKSTVPEWTFVNESGNKHTAKNTALLAASLPGTLISKTGYTDLAGGNMALVYEPIPGRPVAIVVLGSTREERITDATALATFSTARIRTNALCETL